MKALSQCDKCKSFTDLCTVFDAHVRPRMETLLLRTPLVKLPRDSVVPDECAPAVASVREALRNSARCAKDDVWFLLLRTGGAIMERHFRKRPRYHDDDDDRALAYGKDRTATVGGAGASSSNSSIGHTRAKATGDGLGQDDADASSAACGDTNIASMSTTVVTNCFVLFCQHTLPNLSHMTLRWTFLKKELARFESSDAYVRANAAERRRQKLSSVMAVFAEKAHRHHFTALWTSIIAHMNQAALHIHLLHRLGSGILPNLSNPMIVADYLVGCFASGGVISVLALHGLFILMLDHGLEYPQYYEQLYSLLTPSAFASRHRYELFRLLELSMTSVRVPLYMVAAFIKKIARTSLLAPLPTLYFTLPFIRKLLQSHPNCLALIHRSNKEAIVVPTEKDSAGSCTTGVKRGWVVPPVPQKKPRPMHWRLAQQRCRPPPRSSTASTPLMTRHHLTVLRAHCTRRSGS